MRISALNSRARRPGVGDRVTYSVGKDSRGRLQAKAVGFVDQERAERVRGSAFPRSIVGIVALAVAAGASADGFLPPVLAGAYFVLSIFSFVAYMRDKSAAKRDAWRTPEGTLHMLDLLGGWPGGLIAQQRFHHKTLKQSFQFVFWLSVVANIGGVWWFTASGLAEQISAAVVG